MRLFNKVDKKILKQQLSADNQPRVTLSFYCYHQIKNPALFRDHLFLMWDRLGVLGRAYVASEGINAQISVPEENLTAFREELYGISFLNQVRLNMAVEDNGKSFFKLKILVRKKILADGLVDETFDVTQKGIHLTAEEFNQLAEHPEAVIVDMRNHYESEVGHFQNAICPDVDTFRDSLPIVLDLLSEKKEKPVLMYCTGGIRCEKASAWLRHNGFKQVFQLEGGIIKYVHDVRESGLPNKFIGKNFVFDERLGERITSDIIARCHQCGAPCDDHVNCANEGCHLLFIQCQNCKKKMEGCCSSSCMETARLPEAEKKALRAGKSKGRQVFIKGRKELVEKPTDEANSQSGLNQ